MGDLQTLSNSGIVLQRDEAEFLAESWAALHRLSSQMVALFTDKLDLADGDPDEENSTDLEDDFALSPLALGFGAGRGPGCEVSDKGENAWVEWHNLNPGPRKRGQMVTRGAEDDELAGDETDGSMAEDEECASHLLSGSGPGCKVSDAPEDGGDTEPNGDEQEPNGDEGDYSW
jgi:hypothetical protein